MENLSFVSFILFIYINEKTLRIKRKRGKYCDQEIHLRLVKDVWLHKKKIDRPTKLSPSRLLLFSLIIFYN